VDVTDMSALTDSRRT